MGDATAAAAGDDAALACEADVPAQSSLPSRVVNLRQAHDPDVETLLDERLRSLFGGSARDDGRRLVRIALDRNAGSRPHQARSRCDDERTVGAGEGVSECRYDHPVVLARFG